MHNLLYSLVLLISATTLHAKDPNLKSIPKFRNIAVGKAVPSFGGVSVKSNREFSPSTPPGRFFLLIINDQLPPACLDSDCGDGTDVVEKRGGHVIGGCDGKLAASIGMKIKDRKFDASIVAVLDSKGVVTAIYKNAGLKDISGILNEMGSL